MKVYITKHNVIVYNKDYLTEEEKLVSKEVSLPNKPEDEEGYLWLLKADYLKGEIIYEKVEVQKSPEEDIARRVAELEDIILLLTT